MNTTSFAMEQTAEIFRHLRPKWFSRHRASLETKSNGGISFLFQPTSDPGVYDYWIYVCPDDVSFSTKTAVAKLRDAVKRNIIPWGTITLSEDSLLDSAVRSLIAEEGDLPTQAAHQAFKIVINNLSAARLAELFKARTLEARKQYEEHSVW